LKARAAIVILLALTAALAVEAAYAQSYFELIKASWGTSSSEAVVFPGEDASLTVLLRFKPDERSDKAVSILAKLELPSPLRTVGGEPRGLSWASSMGAYEIQAFTFNLHVPSNAKPGSYSFKLSLNYRYVEGDEYPGEEVKEVFYFTLPIYERSELSIKPLTSYLVKGSSQEALFNLSCTGDAPLLVTSISASSTTASVVGVNLTAPTLIPSRSSLAVGVKVYVPLTSTSVDLELKVSYMVYGLQRTATLQASFPAIEGVKPLSLAALDYEVVPDSINTLTLKLFNTQPKLLKEVVLRLSGEQLAVMGGSRVTVDEVPPLGERDVEVKVKPSAQADSYALKVEAEYLLGGEVYTDAFTLSFVKSARPKVSFSSIETSKAGGYVYVRGQVINLGRGPAQYVNVTIEAPRGLKVERTSTYIGTLEPGEAASFLFTCQPEEPGTYLATLTSHYSDEGGAWYAETRQVQVFVEEAREVKAAAPSLNELLLPLIALSVGLFISGLIIGRYTGGRREA